MGKNLTPKGEKAIELIDEFPHTGTRTLARILYKKHPTLYLDYEDARMSIRVHRGEAGTYSRKHINNFREKGNAKNEIRLPDSWAKKKEFFKIPSGYKKIGLIADVQSPFHDTEALQVVVKYLKDYGIDCLLMNGDIIDFYGLSSFEKDPTKRNFSQERADNIELLDWIKDQFKDIPVYYNLDANHENRYERYMQKKAPEIFSTESFMIEDLLMLNDIGIIPVRGYDHIMAGKLPVIHGHTVFRGRISPVSPARTIYMKLKQTAAAAHCHKKSEYTWTNLKGETHCTWTTGCLMNLNVEYNPHGNDYVHGFAHIDIISSDGDFQFHNKMIVNGRVV